MNELIPKLKSDIRDLKIHLLLEQDFTLAPDLNKLRKGNNRLFNQDYWPILKEWKGKSIITGSAALYAFNLSQRLPKDIDLIVDKNNFDPGRELSKNRYPGMDGKLIIGYYADYKRGYNVDFFHGENVNFIELDGFKFHHPFEILLKKLEISPLRDRNNSKDIHDVIYVLKKFQPDYKL